MKLKICQDCNLEFIPTSLKQVCCSKKCNMNKWRKLNPEKCKEQQKRNDLKRKGINRYNSEVRKNWYKQKKEDPNWVNKINNQAKKRSSSIKTFLKEYKLLYGCKDCGYKQHHVGLDFDHIIGTKNFNVCLSKSITEAKKEIKKCEVVCANCHRIRTYNRLHNIINYEPINLDKDGSGN